MAQKVVSVKLQAQVEGFTAGMRKAKASTDDLTKASSRLDKQDAFGNMANKAAIAGVGVATAVGVAVKRFADFDAAMSAVAANSGATGEALNSLRDAAVEMGAASQFSAKEAADGINELAKAGVATQDILNGGLKGALDLAAAGQIGVAQAAETTASALNQFGLAGSDSVHVADLLSNAANAAQGGVGDMAAALGQAGVAAKAAGLNIDETTTLLAVFAKAGMTGSDAGTSLKTMMQRLSAPTGKAAEVMAELGIAAYDTQGNFIGAEAVMEQLATATNGLSTAARSAAFNTIFGQDAIRAASIAAEAGAEGYRAMSAEVTKAGGAAANAAALTDNLTGDVERLGGALDSVFIQTGSGANGSLRALTQGLTGFVDRIGQIPGPLLLAGGALSSFALLAPKGVMAYRDYVGQLDALGLSMDKISARSPRTGKALGALGQAASVAAIAAVVVELQNVVAAASVADVEVDELASSLASLGDSARLGGGLADLFRDQGGWVQSREEVVTLTEAVERFGVIANDAVGDGLMNNLERMSGNGAVPKFEKQVSQLDGALAAMVAAGNADDASAALTRLMENVEPENVEAVRDSFVQYDEALKNHAAQAATTASATDGLSGVQKVAADNAQDAADATKEWTDALNELNQPTLDAREAARELEESVDAVTESIKENGKTLDIGTEKGRANQEALDGVASAANNQIAALQANGASQETLQSTLEASRGRLVAAAKQFGMTDKQAKAYADSVLAIPTATTTTATFKTVGYAALKTAGDYLKGLQDKNIRLTVGTFYVGGQRFNAGQFGDGMPRKATGGAIYGPGTGTSDSILTRLSNGEHVLTAAEVQKLGGQAAVYSLRAAIRQGNLPKYATGGAVMATSRFAPTALAGSSSYSTTHDRSLNAESVTILTPDAESFARGQFRTTPYRAKARPGR